MMQLAEISYMMAIIVAGVFMMIGMIVMAAIYRGYIRITGQEVMTAHFEMRLKENKELINKLLDKVGMGRDAKGSGKPQR